jgi:hypothetical protein
VGAAEGVTITVAVKPAASVIVGGTLSILIRTGIRLASRTTYKQPRLRASPGYWFLITRATCVTAYWSPIPRLHAGTEADLRRLSRLNAPAPNAIT